MVSSCQNTSAIRAAGSKAADEEHNAKRWQRNHLSILLKPIPCLQKSDKGFIRTVDNSRPKEPRGENVQEGAHSREARIKWEPRNRTAFSCKAYYPLYNSETDKWRRKDSECILNSQRRLRCI